VTQALARPAVRRFGLVSLTAGLGALATTRLFCAALAAPATMRAHPIFRLAPHEHRLARHRSQTRRETRSR